MKKLLLAALAAALLVPVGPAQAHPYYHYEGGCGFTTMRTGVESNETAWLGIATVYVSATTADGAPYVGVIHVACDLHKNGVFHDTVLRASGYGAAYEANAWRYWAHPDDVYTMCERVTVGGEQHFACGDA